MFRPCHDELRLGTCRHSSLLGSTVRGFSATRSALLMGDLADAAAHRPIEAAPHQGCASIAAARCQGVPIAYNGSMETPFDEYSARVQKHLESVYGIRVVTRDIPDPLTGDLDGAEIHIDYAVTPEQRLFLLGHLFGHTVQWNVDPASFEHRPAVSTSRE